MDSPLGEGVSASGVCLQEPPVDVAQPEWWTSIPSSARRPAPASVAPGGSTLSDAFLKAHALNTSLNSSIDAIDVMETSTEVFCPPAGGYPSASHLVNVRPNGYPVSSRESSAGSGVPGFFGNSHFSKDDGLKRSGRTSAN